MENGSPRRLALAALALALTGCETPPPGPVSATGIPAAGVGVCENLAQVFYLIAEERDRGRSRASQVRTARQSVDHAFTDDPDETLQYLLHIVDVVYSHPDIEAREIEASVRQSCRVNDLGQAVLRPPWSRP